MKATIEKIKLKIKDIKPNPKNPKKHVDDLIEKSIKETGYISPIVVDENNIILAGHGRFNALTKLGYKEVEVIVKRGLSEKQKEKYMLLDNKLTERGGWDIEMLSDFDSGLLSEAGFSSEELDDILLLDLDDDNFDTEKEYEKITETYIRLGDIYQLGEHRIICGDSRKPEDIESLMDKEIAKIVFTSPPYNMASKMYENYSDNLKSEEYIKFNLDIINNCKKFLKGFVFWNISYNKNSRSEFIEIIYKIIKETGLNFLELIVWDKGHALPITSKEGLTRQYEDILLVGDSDSISSDLELYFCGRNDNRAYFNKKTNRGVTNYWRVGTNKAQLKNLLACFPVALPVKGIELMTSRGEIIMDPFLGSGSTLMAAEKTGRRCFGCELDPKYVEVCINRFEGATDKKAIKLTN